MSTVWVLLASIVTMGLALTIGVDNTVVGAVMILLGLLLLGLSIALIHERTGQSHPAASARQPRTVVTTPDHRAVRLAVAKGTDAEAGREPMGESRQEARSSARHGRLARSKGRSVGRGPPSWGRSREVAVKRGLRP